MYFHLQLLICLRGDCALKPCFDSVPAVDSVVASLRPFVPASLSRRDGCSQSILDKMRVLPHPATPVNQMNDMSDEVESVLQAHDEMDREATMSMKLFSSLSWTVLDKARPQPTANP
jgi:hypothetical protein